MTKRRSSKRHGENSDLIQINCYRKNDALQAAKELIEKKSKEEQKEPNQQSVSNLGTSMASATHMDFEEEDCNLSDNEEEKTTVQTTT